MTIEIDAIQISNFRGIGKSTQTIAEIGKLNLFIGPNNAGKSTVLRLISHYFPASFNRSRTNFKNQLDELDKNQSLIRN